MCMKKREKQKILPGGTWWDHDASKVLISKPEITMSVSMLMLIKNHSLTPNASAILTLQCNIQLDLCSLPSSCFNSLHTVLALQNVACDGSGLGSLFLKSFAKRHVHWHCTLHQYCSAFKFEKLTLEEVQCLRFQRKFVTLGTSYWLILHSVSYAVIGKEHFFSSL